MKQLPIRSTDEAIQQPFGFDEPIAMESKMPALATGFRMPFSGSLTLTQDYGVTGGLTGYPTYKHLGEDWGGTKGTAILAVANGKVVASSSNSSFGNYVVIEHTLSDLTKVYSLYAHLDTRSVTVGQDVYIGAKIGTLGNTGAAEGYHLHWEISTVNQFTQSGMFGKGYDSPTEFLTSSKYTVDPSNFVASHPVTSTQNGSSSADLLWGQSTSERIYGNGGNDTVYGNGGNDTIYGNDGNDTLYGNDGNDLIIGGAGRDLLYGGSGADTFDFNAASESKVGSTYRDVIFDFQAGVDKIDLRTIDASSTLIGDQAFKYIGSQSFHKIAGELRMTSGVIQGDTNGDGLPDFEIYVTGYGTLGTSDFLL